MWEALHPDCRTALLLAIFAVRYAPRETIPHARREKAEAGKLPLDLFDQVLEEIGKYLFQVQIFGNGEPLLDLSAADAANRFAGASSPHLYADEHQLHPRQ